MYELIAELIFLRNQQPADTQGIPPIWQKLVRSEGRPSRASVQQALKKFSFPRKTSVFRGFLYLLFRYLNLWGLIFEEIDRNMLWSDEN